VITFAFYGRVGSLRLQDVASSRAWQITRARQLIEPHGGVIVAEYFDVGHSRALPWHRRPQASQLLAALARPDRGFQAVVIGEPQRAFYDNQFPLTFPLFIRCGVPLWVPEVGGPIDPGSEAHDLAMTLFGSMSKGERMRVKTRVRAAMQAQAHIQGRFLGGRPPYGYQLADAGPHPNPGKADLGARLHRLEPDPVTAPVVERIFQLFFQGCGYYAIAEQLTSDGVPSPSGYDPERNPHRDGRAWNKHAVRAILTNPRYTGYQVWNRQRRDEVLLDVHDVAAGYTSRMRWNSSEAWVWSEQPAHPALISREAFDAVQRLIATRTRPRTVRKPRATPRLYLLRRRLRCGLCERCMQGHWVREEAYYRCRYPAQYAIATTLRHPKSVNLREADLLPHLDGWIAELFDPANLDTTCAQLVSLTNGDANNDEIAKAHHVIRECDLALRRYRAALEQGANPETVGQWINGATAKKTAAKQRLQQLRQYDDVATLTARQVRELVQRVGAIVKELAGTEPTERAGLYQQLGIELIYRPTRRLVVATADLRWHIEGVGGPTGPLGLPEFTTPVAV
jgi:DNA invertase Pin-like site-specific DNA recombinase